jgi:hypothetical protein
MTGAGGVAGVYKQPVTAVGDPLDGIGDVAWERLYHAYGPAIDVPDQLRALRSPDQDKRGKAQWQLWGNVYHQGSRWQGSHAVVRFLVALIEDPATPDRADLLQLLTAIAIGDRRDDELPLDADSTFATGHDLAGVDMTELLHRFYSDDDLTEDEMELLEAEAVRWAADCYHATAAFLPTITSWVSDPDDDVAAYAAALLPWFPPAPAALSALIDVPAPRAQPRASANLALAHWPQIDPRIEQHLQRLLHATDDPVAVTAAVALAYRTGTALPDQALSILIDGSTRDLPAGVAGWDRALRGFVMLALHRLGLG